MYFCFIYEAVESVKITYIIVVIVVLFVVVCGEEYFLSLVIKLLFE